MEEHQLRVYGECGIDAGHVFLLMVAGNFVRAATHNTIYKI
jgi:hypothetical protein